MQKKYPLRRWFLECAVIFPVLQVIIDFVLLGSSDEYLDLVMNSTAILFILEIDDSMMYGAVLLR